MSGVSGTGTQTFAYDDLGRVTGATGLSGEGRAYSYDRDGNRVQKSDTAGGTTTTIDYAFDRTGELASALVSTGGPPTNPATFDVFGNLTGNAESGTGSTAMTYDAADCLTSIDDGTAATANDATYGLDALGRFSSRTVGGVGGTTDTYRYLGTTESVTTSPPGPAPSRASSTPRARGQA